MSNEFDTVLEKIFEKDNRYREDAYEFVMEALTYTQKKFNSSTHVSGEQILTGIRELLIKQYGPMAMNVLEHWGIQSTEDFGNIVFNLVDNKVLSKTETDSIEVFRNAYDFDEVFRQGYRKSLHKKIGRMRSM
ncbi:MAG: hypothetical protein KC684_10085 [Candidatus Omnitrophica bacterium]|nr:hypothetical protein [Candidatus Omnitrophota bacterium]